jgi:hypothetical protein
MAQWHHLRDPALITDPILRDAAGDIVSMVFATQSHDRQLGAATAAQPAAANDDDEDDDEEEGGAHDVAEEDEGDEDA